MQRSKSVEGRVAACRILGDHCSNSETLQEKSAVLYKGSIYQHRLASEGFGLATDGEDHGAVRGDSPCTRIIAFWYQVNEIPLGRPWIY